MDSTAAAAKRPERSDQKRRGPTRKGAWWRNGLLRFFLLTILVAIGFTAFLWAQAVPQIVPHAIVHDGGPASHQSGDAPLAVLSAEPVQQPTKARPATTNHERAAAKRSDSPMLFPPIMYSDTMGKSHLHQSQQQNEQQENVVAVDPNDYIYRKEDWGSAPIVVQEFRLIFFTIPKVACTVWKQLFRRIAGQSDNWNKQQRYNDMLNHNPKFNGLAYLWNYSIDDATKMLNSPNWTRAIFLRDPQERVVSAFMDKSFSRGGQYVREKCCNTNANNNNNANVHVNVTTKAQEDKCVHDAGYFEGFLDLIEVCDNPHWRPQSQRMEPKYWKLIDFVGRMDRRHVQDDAKRLLQRIGAWDDYGQSGWGKHGNMTIFETNTAMMHHTNSTSKINLLIPRYKVRIQNYYRNDYTYLGLPLSNNVSQTILDRDYAWKHRNVHRYRSVLNSVPLEEMAKQYDQKHLQ